MVTVDRISDPARRPIVEDDFVTVTATAASSTLSRQDRAWLRVQAVACLVTVGAALSLYSGLIDDAYITFRYSYNLAHFGEYVFNRGEWVEGATNLLWALLVAPLTLVPARIETSVLTLSLVCLAWAAWRSTQCARALGAGPVQALLAAALLATNLAFLHTMTSGLEAPLFAALMAEMMLRLLRGQIVKASVCSSLLFLTRPEAVVFGPLIVLAGWGWGGAPARRAWLGLSLWLATVLGVTLLRWLIYGSFVPNSVIAKMTDLTTLSHSRFGARYVLDFWISAPYLPLIAIGAGLRWLKYMQQRTGPILAVGVALTGIALSYVVTARNGGDWMPDFRLLSQYLVLYSLLAAWLLSRRVERGSAALTYAIAGLCIVFGAAQVARGPVADPGFGHGAGIMHRVPRMETEDAAFYDAATERLNGRLGAGDVISAEAIGRIGWNLIDARFHDPTGLMDPYLARHGKLRSFFGSEDVNYTLGTVAPRVVLWHSAAHLKSADPAVVQRYEMRCYSHCEDTWRMRLVMLRRDQAGALREAFAGWPAVEIRGGVPSLMP